MGSREVERRAIVHAGEHDTHTSWRKVTAYLTRAGATSKIKRETRRRERREAKEALRNL